MTYSDQVIIHNNGQHMAFLATGQERKRAEAVATARLRKEERDDLDASMIKYSFVSQYTSERHRQAALTTSAERRAQEHTAAVEEAAARATTSTNAFHVRRLVL